MTNIFRPVKIKSRKAQVGDIAFLIVTLLSICMTLIIGRYIFVKFDEGIKGTGMNTTESDKVFTDMQIMFPMLDNMMLFIVAGLTVGLLITSFLLPTHPMFMIFNIVGLIILVFLSAILSNVYHDITQESDINSVLIDPTAPTDFAKTEFLMNKLPWICSIIVLLSTIVMYAKGREGVI